MEKSINKTTLKNGLTVISEHIPSVRSISVGTWIKTGTRFENKTNNGIAHFLEHMVFKGTKKRSAFKIAQSLEELGGSINAYTSKELTVFYTHSLDTHLAISVNVLADLVCNPLFRERDIELEKQVVFEEINSVKDTPDEYIFDLFQEKMFPENPLGFPILGTTETVAGFTREMLVDFWRSFYCPNNMVISAAGNVDHNKFVKLVERHFHFDTICSTATTDPAVAARQVDLDLNEPVSQSHICAGIEGLSYLSEDRFNLIAVNAYLGSGMSSRLFQVIREKHALAYTVYSFVDFYKDTGIFSVYLGTDKQKYKKAVDILFAEVNKLVDKPIKNSLVRKVKEQLKGGMLLGLESSYRRMSRLAKNEIYYNRQVSIDDLIENIDTVNSESMLDLSRKIFIMDKFNIIRLLPNA